MPINPTPNNDDDALESGLPKNLEEGSEQIEGFSENHVKVHYDSTIPDPLDGNLEPSKLPPENDDEFEPGSFTPEN